MKSIRENDRGNHKLRINRLKNLRNRQNWQNLLKFNRFSFMKTIHFSFNETHEIQKKTKSDRRTDFRHKTPQMLSKIEEKTKIEEKA